MIHSLPSYHYCAICAVGKKNRIPVCCVWILENNFVLYDARYLNIEGTQQALETTGLLEVTVQLSPLSLTEEKNEVFKS